MKCQFIDANDYRMVIYVLIICDGETFPYATGLFSLTLLSVAPMDDGFIIPSLNGQVDRVHGYHVTSISMVTRIGLFGCVTSVKDKGRKASCGCFGSYKWHCSPIWLFLSISLLRARIT